MVERSKLNHNRRLFLQYDKNGNLLNQYPSVTIAALKNGYNF